MTDPRVRNELLLIEWEGETPSTVAHVHFSKKCANSEIGLGFTAALVKAAYEQETQS